MGKRDSMPSEINNTADMDTKLDDLDFDDHSHSNEALEAELKRILSAREDFSNDPKILNHDQVPFLGFEVDSKLKEIVSNLWLMGLFTDFSCQGYPELCHPNLEYSLDYYAQIIFLDVDAGIRFLTFLTGLLGPGTSFGPDGITLNTLEGDLSDLEAQEISERELVERMYSRTRAEVTFHPNFIPIIDEALEHHINTSEFDHVRSLLEFADDLDDAYKTLHVSDYIRTQAESKCDCGEDH